MSAFQSISGTRHASSLSVGRKKMHAIIRARVKMKPEGAGGRHGPFNEGYCPHLVVAGKRDWLGVRVVQCPDFVFPGEEKEILFECMYGPSVDYSDLRAGRKFSIHEGSKVIGEGTVVGDNQG